MLQRIQTIYLFLAACAFALCLMFPIAVYDAPIESTQQTVHARLDIFARVDWVGEMQQKQPAMAQGGDVTLMPDLYASQRGLISTWYLAILAIGCLLISAASIMMYGNRVRQMRVVAVAFLLGVIYIFMIFFMTVDSYGKTITQMYQCGTPTVAYHVATWAGVAGVAFLFLAQRAIRKDEAKVRDADRLR